MTESFEVKEIEKIDEIPENFHIILVLGYREMPEGVAEKATRKAALVDLRGLAIGLRDSKYFGFRVTVLVEPHFDEVVLREVVTRALPMNVTVMRFKQ